MWNIILNSLDGNKIVQPKNNPTESGKYICTCIIKRVGVKSDHRYLAIVEYDAKRNKWHDVGRPNATSHVILAWKQEEICDLNDFDYKKGLLFEKGPME